MTHRATALGNDNTTATGDNSFNITVPGSVVAGDVMAVTASINAGAGTFAISGGGTGSSWTAQSGPDDNNTNLRTYLWTKTATASSASSTVTVTSTGQSGRFLGVLRADSGVTETGLLVGLATDTSGDVNLAFASVPVPAGATGWSLVGIGSMRVAAATAATVSAAPSGSTTDAESNTNTASPNYTAIALHKTATVGAGAQSLGTGTASASVTDNLYTIGYPPASGATVVGATATGTAQAYAGEATGSGAVAIVTAQAHAGVAIAGTQDATVVGATAEATAQAYAGLAPALAITATPEPDQNPPRVRIDITDTRATPATAVTVTRIDPDGSRVTVRTPDGLPFGLTLVGSSRVGVLYDYEPTYEQQVTYTLEENPTAISPTTLDVADPWLVHPGVPSRSIRLRVVDLPTLSRPVQRGVFYPLGRGEAVVNTDGRRKAPAGTLTVRTDTDPDRTAMNNILDDTQTLLLNVPASKRWGIGSMYVAVGDVDEDRYASWGKHPSRLWKLPFVQVARPAGGSQAQWNLAAVDAGYATLAAVRAAFPTLADLQANTPVA